MYQLSVLIHVLSAIIWVGGILFLALVVVPVTRGLPPAERAALFSAVGRRFRLVGWTALGLLVVTGIVNSAYRGVTWENLFSGQILASTFGQLLVLKLGLVLTMVIVSYLHDFVIGPTSVQALATGSAPAEEVVRIRRRAAGLARLSGLLAVLVIAVAVALVRGLPW